MVNAHDLDHHIEFRTRAVDSADSKLKKDLLMLQRMFASLDFESMDAREVRHIAGSVAREGASVQRDLNHAIQVGIALDALVTLRNASSDKSGAK